MLSASVHTFWLEDFSTNPVIYQFICFLSGDNQLAALGQCLASGGARLDRLCPGEVPLGLQLPLLNWIGS